MREPQATNQSRRSVESGGEWVAAAVRQPRFRTPDARAAAEGLLGFGFFAGWERRGMDQAAAGVFGVVLLRAPWEAASGSGPGPASAGG